MDLSNLTPAKGSVKNRKRIGRGQGSGRGGTSTRGHKGQQSRSGYSRKVGFEGGQQPIQRRVPKFGFRNINRKEYKGINLDTLQGLAENKKIKEIDIETLITNGLVSKNEMVKILGRGELKAKLEVTAHAFSKTARTAVEEKGGKAIVLTRTRTEVKDAGISTVKKNKEKPQLSGNGTKAGKITKTEKEDKTQEVSGKESKSKKAEEKKETLSKVKPKLSGDETKVKKPEPVGDSKTVTKTADPVASADTKTVKPSKGK